MIIGGCDAYLCLMRYIFSECYMVMGDWVTGVRVMCYNDELLGYFNYYVTL